MLQERLLIAEKNLEDAYIVIRRQQEQLKSMQEDKVESPSKQLVTVSVLKGMLYCTPLSVPLVI